MAYAAAVCLMNTTKCLYYSNHISLVPPSKDIVIVANEVATSLMVLLEKLDETSKGRSRERVNALDGKIREVVTKFEDMLESRVADQLLSQSGRKRKGGMFSIDLLDLKKEIRSFTKRLRKLRISYRKALNSMLGDEDDGVVSSVTGFGGRNSSMVGLSDQFHEVKAWVADGSSPNRSHKVLLGMGGIGKTTLAKEVFEDPDVKSHFYHRMWVTVGRKYRTEEILRVLVAQLNPGNEQILAEGKEDLAGYLKESLKDRRFLIVVDDVWDSGDWRDLLNSTPNDQNGSRVLLTSRLHGEAYRSAYPLEVRFLNKEESWELLRENVFGKEPCPPQLEKAGKKIAENCDGLPLTILKIARLLSEAEMTPEYWDEVAEERNSVFTDAYDEISEVQFPSYDYLPQYLKMCFLSTGVFPKKTVIPRSKIINMWGVEDFLLNVEEGYVTDLVGHSLFKIYELSTTKTYILINSSVKTFGVQSSLWHLCKREAGKTKSFHVLRSRKDGLCEGMKSQRRLSIHNNVLFAIKDVHNSMEDEHCSSSVRSLGCYGPYHPYQVPITFGLRLLRLLEALTIRFYEFPMEVVKLVLLRYLALTYNGILPASISKLLNLRFLIVRQHLRIVKSSFYLPMKIWDMKELEHLQVTGSDLPDPTPVDTCLPNLSTLLDVSGDSCTEGVLRRTPFLKKLGVRIELRPDGHEPFSWLANIFRLLKLEILKCAVVNPEIVASPTPLPNFSRGIKKLTLSGLGYPWKEMNKIASLPYLQVLKLRNYAFHGPEWHMEEYSFSHLSTLIIEDTDLEHWTVAKGSFSFSFSCINLKHCYKFKEIHWETHEKLPRMIRVVDCNPLILPCWEKLIKSSGSSNTIVDAHSSWMMDSSTADSQEIAALPVERPNDVLLALLYFVDK